MRESGRIYKPTTENNPNKIDSILVFWICEARHFFPSKDHLKYSIQIFPDIFLISIVYFDLKLHQQQQQQLKNEVKKDEEDEARMKIILIDVTENQNPDEFLDSWNERLEIVKSKEVRADRKGRIARDMNWMNQRRNNCNRLPYRGNHQLKWLFNGHETWNSLLSINLYCVLWILDYDWIICIRIWTA